jgi:hypothetical protein
LPELIERRDAAFDQGTPVLRRLDTARTAFKKAQPDRVFQVGNRFRNCRLGHPKAFRRLMHAARFHHRDKNAHIAQFDPTFDALDIIHGGHPSTDNQ